MADKYIYDNSGTLTEKELVITSAGAGDSGKGIALDAAGKLDSTFMPSGYAVLTETYPASEDLTAGQYVNLFDDTGTMKARKADCSNGRVSHGFVLAGATSGNNATVYRNGVNSQLSGLTAGSKYYLSTAGSVTDTPTTTTAQYVQPLGVAGSATSIATYDFALYWVKA